MNSTDIPEVAMGWMLWDLDLGGSFLVKTAAFPTSEVYDHIKSNTELIVTSDVITHAKIHQV